MGHENILKQHQMDLFRHLFETWGICNHLIIDPGEGLYIPRDRLTRVYQCLEPINYFFTIIYMDCHFCDPVCSSITARGFYVDDRVQLTSFGFAKNFTRAISG